MDFIFKYPVRFRPPGSFINGFQIQKFYFLSHHLLFTSAVYLVLLQKGRGDSVKKKKKIELLHLKLHDEGLKRSETHWIINHFSFFNPFASLAFCLGFPFSAAPIRCGLSWGMEFRSSEEYLLKPTRTHKSFPF